VSITANKVINRIRTELKDEIAPYFWSDDELLAYIDEAQMELCTRGYRILDSTSPAICEIQYKANAFKLPIHESILKILSVVREDSNGVLHNVRQATEESSLHMFPIRPSDYGHNTADAAQALTSPGDMFEVYVDYDEDFIRLSSPALTDGTLLLHVERLPYKEITDCEQELEVRREHVSAIIAWVAFRAWSKQDAETFDSTASNRSLALFETFADRARIDFKRRTSQPGQIKYGGL